MSTTVAGIIIAVAGILLGAAAQPLYELFLKGLSWFDKLDPTIKTIGAFVISTLLSSLTQLIPNLPTDLHNWTAGTILTVLTFVVNQIVNKFVKKSAAPATK